MADTAASNSPTPEGTPNRAPINGAVPEGYAAPTVTQPATEDLNPTSVDVKLKLNRPLNKKAYLLGYGVK